MISESELRDIQEKYYEAETKRHDYLYHKNKYILKPEDVIDEDKSVKWNREEKARRNLLVENEVERNKKETMELKTEYEEAFYDYYMNNYGKGLITREQVKVTRCLVNEYREDLEEYDFDEYMEAIEEILDIILLPYNKENKN